MKVDIDSLIELIKMNVYENHRQDVTAIMVQDAVSAVARNVGVSVNQLYDNIEEHIEFITKQVVFKDEITQDLGDSSNKAMSQKAVTDEIIQLAGEVSKKSKYPYEDGFLFSKFVLNAGIDKWLIDAYFDWNSEEGFRYSFAIISKTDLYATLYKHVDGQPAEGNITYVGTYTFVKIPGSKYYKGTLSTKPNDWIIADFDAMTVESQFNMYYTNGVGLSPRLFKNGIQKPTIPLQTLGESETQTVSQKKITEEINDINSRIVPFDGETMTLSNTKINDISYIHSEGLPIYEGNNTYFQVAMGTYLAPQGHKLLVRRIKTKMYCGFPTATITARVYKSKTLHEDPTNNKTLIEEVVFGAGTFKNVAEGFQEIVLSQDTILEADDYLYLYIDSGSNRVVLPIWNRLDLGQPEEPLTRMIFKKGVEGDYYFGNSPEYLSTPLLLLSSASDISEDITELSNQVADHEGRIETLETSIPSNSPIEISLPDTIYAVVGDALQLFYRGMIAHPYPYIYDILPTCSKGKNYPRYFYYLPTVDDVGTTTFKVEVKDKDGNILGSKTCNLVTKAAVQAPATDKKVLCVGDSLTSAGTWCIEASRRLIGTGGTPVGLGLTNISFLGRKTGSGIGWEGNGGWTWYSYIGSGREAYKFYVSGVTTAPAIESTYTNNGVTYTISEVNITEGAGYVSATGTGSPSASGILTKASGEGDVTLTFSSSQPDAGNPFWESDTNSLDFPQYVNTYMNGGCDVIYFLLSWNGQSPHKTDFTSVINSAKVLVDHIHTNYPNCKMKIMGIQVPSLNGGMGANYGATGTSYADTYGMVVTALNMNKAYQDWCNESAYSSFLEFVNISSQFDSENNMPESDVPVNSRSSKTEKIGTNGVHPATAGYYQIADVVFRNFVANFCQ